MKFITFKKCLFLDLHFYSVCHDKFFHSISFFGANYFGAWWTTGGCDFSSKQKIKHSLWIIVYALRWSANGSITPGLLALLLASCSYFYPKWILIQGKKKLFYREERQDFDKKGRNNWIFYRTLIQGRKHTSKIKFWEVGGRVWGGCCQWDFEFSEMHIK